MGLCQRSRRVMQLLIINLLCWLVWFSGIALAQSDIFRHAYEPLFFRMEAITCLINIIVFCKSLTRGRLDQEICAREAIAAVVNPELEKIKTNNGYEIGLSTCMQEHLETACVVMLSNETPNSNSYVRHFMQSNAVDGVHSILLQYLPLEYARIHPRINLIDVIDCTSSLPAVADLSKCTINTCSCKCIVFCTMEKITTMLAPRMPLVQLSNSLCLVPCLSCIRNGCHRWNRGVLVCGEGSLLVELVDELFPGILNDSSCINAEEHICICIPVRPPYEDRWTKLLIGSLKSKDDQRRGVEDIVSEVMENYLKGNGRRNNEARVQNNNKACCFKVSRFLEILINLILTFWFKVDGFSSSLMARMSISDYLVNGNGSGLVASAFLTKVVVKSGAPNTQLIYQVLSFRGNLLGFLPLTFILGGVNFICFIGWAVLIFLEGGYSSWALSLSKVVLIIGVIGIALFMDGFYLYSNHLYPGKKLDYNVLLVIIMEMVCIVAGIVVVRTLDVKRVGKWVYCALQGLVWIKWGVGSYILDKHFKEPNQWGVIVYSSSFLLNAALAGVRSM